METHLGNKLEREMIGQMEVFISWSGENSHQLALILKDWMSKVIQIIEPWVSSEDIEKGDRWTPEIAQKLDNCNVGIICLTKYNFEAPWINFEAGALSKKLENGKVCTLLLDLKPTDIKGPLAQFQATIAKSQDDMKKLINIINKSLGDKRIKDNIVNEAFDIWWERYLQKVNTIIPMKSNSSEERVRTNKDLLEEILLSIRELNKTSSEKDKKLIEAENELLASKLYIINLEEKLQLLKSDINLNVIKKENPKSETFYTASNQAAGRVNRELEK